MLFSAARIETEARELVVELVGDDHSRRLRHDAVEDRRAPRPCPVSRIRLRFPTAVSAANVTMIGGDVLRAHRIDLDHRGAELDEDPSARGAGDDVAQVDDR